MPFSSRHRFGCGPWTSKNGVHNGGGVPEQGIRAIATSSEHHQRGYAFGDTQVGVGVLTEKSEEMKAR